MTDIVAHSSKADGSGVIKRLVAHYARGLTQALHRRMELLEIELAVTRQENDRLRAELTLLLSEHRATVNRVVHLEESLASSTR